jgi:hypothetical protein
MKSKAYGFPLLAAKVILPIVADKFLNKKLTKKPKVIKSFVKKKLLKQPNVKRCYCKNCFKSI